MVWISKRFKGFSATPYNKTDNLYKIEKILKKKGNGYLVKWLGYPDEFNSWINKKDLIENYLLSIFII